MSVIFCWKIVPRDKEKPVWIGLGLLINCGHARVVSASLIARSFARSVMLFFPVFIISWLILEDCLISQFMVITSGEKNFKLKLGKNYSSLTLKSVSTIKVLCPFASTAFVLFAEQKRNQRFKIPQVPHLDVNIQSW